MPPQRAREHFGSTSQIKSILDGCPFGVAILGELLRNSDDAKAATQVFILDRRTHSSGSLFDPSLKECQGPALLAVNDTVFQDPEDWEALQKVHGSDTVSDESMTGKYGLGFRANYHLTDNPHVLSGDRLYIADPHKWLPGALNGGGYFSLKQGDGITYIDHFKAFEAAHIDPRASYVTKTVVRLPLRTRDQANRGKICSTPISPEDIKSLFDSFIDDELHIVLLFLKNIAHIELVEVAENGTRTTLGSASLAKRQGSENSWENMEHTSTTFLADYRVQMSPTGSARSSTWRIYRRTFSRKHASSVLAPRLHRQANQLEKDLGGAKMVADVCMAYCIDQPITNGRLFTLLPLPLSISPKIPIHLNCNFALTSDRQHLKNPDHINNETIQKHRHGLLVNWNKAIFEDLVPPTWASLAEFLARDLREKGTLNRIWSAFPLNLADAGSERSFWGGLLGFVLGELVRNNLEVFPVVGGDKAYPLRGAFIADSKDVLCPKQVLSKLGLRIIAPPLEIYEQLRPHTLVLNPNTVAKKLRERVAALSSCLEEEKDAILTYLISGMESDLDTILDLPLIPLTTGERVSLKLKPLTRIPVVRGLDGSAIKAWTKLGISFLDKRVSCSRLERFCVSLDSDIGFFMQCIDPIKMQPLTSEDWDSIRDSIINLRNVSFLSPGSLGIYKGLPLFPVRENVPVGVEGGNAVSITRQGAIRGSLLFVQPLPSCPIPLLSSITTFIDAQVDNGLRRLLGDSTSPILGEVDLLKMALDNWELQPPHLQQRFLPRVLSRLVDMPSYAEVLRNLPFIPVGDRLFCPRDVVDPDSPIAYLYDIEDLPTGTFSKGSSLLQLCRMHDLLCQTLTSERLRDRIKSIAENGPRSFSKASRLLQILETSWRVDFEDVIKDSRSLAWIPVEDDSLCTPEICFFNDYPNHYEPAGRFGHPISSTVSPSLAQKIKIPFLSSLKTHNEADDEGEEEMCVELLNRIQAVLHDYDVKYAINEFLTNAHDAGATEFSMMLDMCGYSMDPGELPISPSFPKLLSQPALIIYNNAKFTDKDFEGILQIDKEGKLDDPDEIGRYGLGALFCFTDVVTIVSGEHVLIMDPSADHLPHTKTGRKRTALKRSVKSLYRDSPSLLRPFHGKYDFQLSQGCLYDGTMFRLPLLQSSALLRATQVIDSHACRELLVQYQDLAQSALFFTNFTRIDAYVLVWVGAAKSLWEVKGTRTLYRSGQISMTELTLQPNGETWYIARTRAHIPEEFKKQVPYRIKSQDVFPIEVALSQTHVRRDHSLFSVFCLPSPISIPCHCNAPFSLPSSRRGIHLDTAGGSNKERSIIEAGWNRWILSEEIPHLYIGALSILKDIPSFSIFDFFPTRGRINEISQEILRGFYDHLKQSPAQIFPTISGTWVSYNAAIFLSDLPININRTHIENILRLLRQGDVVLMPQSVRRRLNIALYTEAKIQGNPPQVLFPAMFREILLSNDTRIKELYSARDLVPEIWSALQLILFCKQSVTGLCLLLTGGGIKPDLRQFPQESHPVFYEPDGPLRSVLIGLLEPESIIHSSIPDRCAELMSRSVPPLITKFDAKQAVMLIQRRLREAMNVEHSSDTIEWIQHFWELCTHIPELWTLPNIWPYPIIPTLQPNRYVSISAYQRLDTILTYDALSISPELLSILHEYGFSVVDRDEKPHLPRSLGRQRNKLTLPVLLAGLHSLDKIQSDFLKIGSHEKLALWIRNACRSEVPKPGSYTYRLLISLPIWPASQRGKRQLYASRSLYYAPPNVQRSGIEVLEKHLKFPFAICDPQHSTIIQQLGGNELTLSLILERIRHSTLPVALFPSYVAVLNELCSFPSFQKRVSSILLPDGSGNMNPVDSFYSTAEPIFVEAFGVDNKAKFIHPHIRSTLNSIYSANFERDVDYRTLLECLRAVDNLARTTYSSSDVVVARVRRFFSRFEHHFARSSTLSSSEQYSHLHTSSLKFVVRADKRTSRATYDIKPYVGSTTTRYLPRILSPSQVVVPRLEGIAWTQRGVMEKSPSYYLSKVIPLFGVPTVQEVVQHLQVLVEIAGDHPMNLSLLQDIRETYSWLSEKTSENPWELSLVFRSWTDKKLFLNVDDPTAEEWSWNSANEIILNLHDDRPGRQIFGAHAFLEKHRDFLLRAGCREIVDVSCCMQSTPEVLVIPPVFNTMRQSRQATDMELMPQEQGEISTDFPHLYCHRVILEAAVPHLQSSLYSGLSESLENTADTVKRYKIFCTRYCAAKLLEFVYTNKVTIAKAHEEDVDALLSELSGLLSIANQWELEALKTEVGRIIVDELRLLNILNYKQIREQAETYRAETLLRACNDFERRNAKIIEIWERNN